MPASVYVFTQGNLPVTLPAHAAPADSSAPWKAWVCGLVAVFCVCLPNPASARTDLDRMEMLAETQYGATTTATVRAWRSMIAETRTQPDTVKLRRTNDFINNRILFEDDIVVWRKIDYWATPLELFGKQAGDCEDFAIAKYITLLLLDIPMEKLRLVYARARVSGVSSTSGKQTQAHMVLSYFATPSTEPLVLDNLTDEIRPANRRPDLFPVFSFNHAGLWMQGARTSSADPTTRLSRWRDVVERMRREGLDISSLSSKSSQKFAKTKSSSRKAVKTQKSTRKVAKTRASSRKATKTRTSSRKVARR
jgi:predicted transglutaminase-like cysteine proteinase